MFSPFSLSIKFTLNYYSPSLAHDLSTLAPLSLCWTPLANLPSGLNPIFQFGVLPIHLMEKTMAPHSSTLGWKIPRTEEPGRLQSMESLRVGHDWATSLSLFTFLHWRRKWQPTPVFLPGESQGWGSLVAAIYGVTQSPTRLKWLSSSSSSQCLEFIEKS